MCCDPGVMQGSEFLPGAGLKCVGFSAGARARAVGSVPAALPPRSPRSNSLVEPKYQTRVGLFKTKPSSLCGEQFVQGLLPLLFPVPRSSGFIVESFGCCRGREERGCSAPPRQSTGSGDAPRPPPKTAGRGGRKAQIDAPPAQCPFPAFFQGDSSPLRPTPSSRCANPPEGAVRRSQRRPAAGAAAAVPPPEGFWGRKGSLAECFVPAAGAVALPVRFGRGAVLPGHRAIPDGCSPGSLEESGAVEVRGEVPPKINSPIPRFGVGFEAQPRGPCFVCRFYRRYWNS